MEDDIGVELTSYEEIYDKCDIKDKETIKNIFNTYEIFRKEVEHQINDKNKDFIKITCNGIVYKKITSFNFWNREIKLMKNQIKKVEYFKGYTAAIRIELNNEVYFINAIVEDTKLIKYTMNM